MPATALNRPVISLARIFGLEGTRKPVPRGPLPDWIDDPRLSDHLLRDTGLLPEDLGGTRTYDEDRPFFMQKTFW